MTYSCYPGNFVCNCVYELFQLTAKFEQLFQSISQIETDISLLDMHSLTDMVDHIQLIIKTLQVFEKEVDQMKRETDALEADEPELRQNLAMLEQKLALLTTRSEKALKIVEVCFEGYRFRVLCLINCDLNAVSRMPSRNKTSSGMS